MANQKVQTQSNGQTISKEQLHYSIVGLGNPLLDICATVPDDFLSKYALKLDNAILAEEKHMPLYDEMIRDFETEFVAGGATQNSIRIAQWMLKHACDEATSFLGCVGKDSYASQLKKCAEKDGVNVHYMEDNEVPTGTCAVCVKDGERSLVANLSAANNFKIEHLHHEKTKDIINKGKYYYSAGFHLTVCPPAVLHLAQHAAENDKIFMINLSAPFIVQFFKEPLMEALAYSDYVFGNESEAAEFGKGQEWGEDIAKIAMNISKLPKKSGARGRIVVFTQGAKPTIVATNGQILKFDVPALKQEEIVDTNGAGDAFVGGFLSHLALGENLKECVEAGHWSAQVVIRQSGCTFPEKCAYKDQ